MKQLIDFAITCAEKYLVPSCVALSAAIMCRAITGDDFWVLQKVGQFLYVLLLFCVFFLLTLIIQNLAQKTIKTLNRRKRQIKEDIYREREVENDILNWVDTLSVNERRRLDFFLKTNNKRPLVVVGGSPFDIGYGDGKNLRLYCISQECSLSAGEKYMNYYTIKEEVAENDYIATMVKIEPNNFHNLKWLEERRGSISRF